MTHIAAGLSVLILLVGVAVCAIYVTRVRWAAVLAVGFALQAVWLGYAPFLTWLAWHGIFAGKRSLLLLASLGGVLGSAVVVAGVAGLLIEHVHMRQGSSGRA